MYKLYTISTLIGQRTAARHLSTLTSQRAFTQSDVNTFAEISGDNNSIHVDTSEDNKYGRPIVHGTLILGHVSGMLATALPGALLLRMDVSFNNYLHVDKEIAITISPVKLQRATLHVDMKGIAADKEIFNGNVDVGLTKSLLRKLRTENPELVQT